MNKIESITNLPAWQWKPNSEREIIISGEELVGQSDFVWRVGNVAIVGFIHTSYLTAPWMWFLLANNVTIADLVDFRRCAELIPKGTLTAVATDFALALRFAKLYNFVETDEQDIEYGDRVYRVMRKI